MYGNSMLVEVIMFNIEITERKGIKVIDSKLLHKQLEVKSYHSDWIRRRIENYGFIEKKDFYIDQYSTVRGGKKRKVYLITVDMSKHLAMIENNHTGEKVRDYFIAVEKEYYKTRLAREIGKEVRKSLTDAVQESGEQERMHGHGYSTYTNMVYDICDLKESYKVWKDIAKNSPEYAKGGFRAYLHPSSLKRVEQAEAFIKPLLEMDKQYKEIQTILKPLFETKEIT